MTPEHEMQHADEPTWCIHCGTFDVYCGYYPCEGPRTAQFDSRKQENWLRMAKDMFPANAEGE